VAENSKNVQTLVDQMTAKCNGEKASFKQEYLLKYEKDIAEFNTQIDLKINADNELLREAMNNQCQSEKSS